MRSRSWNWLRNRIFGLLTRPPAVTWAGDVLPVNRLQASLRAPAQPPQDTSIDGREA